MKGEAYQPEKTTWRGTKHLLYGDVLFILVSIVGLYVMSLLEDKYTALDPSGAVFRFTYGKAINFIGFAFVGSGLLRVVDRTCGGNLKRGILYDPIACALFAGAVFVTCGLVWINYQ